jgi:hypothetical protein
MRKKKIAGYNTTISYLDYLTALRKFFTNDADIIPIIMGFNFYINGVYQTPYTDLFRMYDENIEDIHGAEKTKSFIDDGTIGIINEQIFKNGSGSLITSLENLRVFLLDRTKKYNVTYNPFINAYAEFLNPVVNDLGTSNPEVNNNKDGLTQEQVNENLRQERLKEIERQNTPYKGDQKVETITAPTVNGGIKGLPPKTKKTIWKYLSFLSYKNSANYKKKIELSDIEKRIESTGDYYKNLNKG